MKVLMNPVRDATDRHDRLVNELDTVLLDLTAGAHPRVALEALRAQILKARQEVDELAALLERGRQAWKDRPRRGPTPELRVTLHAQIGPAGAWRASWSPVFQSYDDVKAFQGLLVMERGSVRHDICVPGFHEIVDYLRRSAQAGSLERRREMEACRRALTAVVHLQDAAAALIGTICPLHVQSRVEIGYGGEVSEVDLDEVELGQLKAWTLEWEARQALPLAELRHAAETGLSISALHRHMCQLTPEAQPGLAEVSRALARMQAALGYNAAWWRSGPRVPLPEAAPLARILPANRTLVQKEGRQPRMSPIATRGVEGSGAVDTTGLRGAMAERIATASPRWHFTAGDFMDLVEPDDRKRVLRCLDRLKRTSVITPVSKGVYRRTDGHRDPLSGLQALLRDRDEHACPVPDERMAFYTDGRLRSFRYGEATYRLRPEPHPGLCRAAQQVEDGLAFARLALHLTRKDARRTREISRLIEARPQEAQMAEQLVSQNS